MGKIFYVMGKSASGKDTVFKHLRERLPQLKTMTMYTTRPIRDGEQEGVEYYFVDQAYLERCRERGTLIECRTYDTVLGPWSYFTADDGQIRLEHGDYLMIGTLESYGRMKEFYGTDALVPIYIYVEDGLRLQRAWNGNGSRRNQNMESCADGFWQTRWILRRRIWNFRVLKNGMRIWNWRRA